MNKHENISVFSKGTCANGSNNKMIYNPQGLIEVNKIVCGIKKCKADSAEGGHKFARKSHKKNIYNNSLTIQISYFILIMKVKQFTLHKNQ